MNVVRFLLILLLPLFLAPPAISDAFRLLTVDGVLVKWGAPALGAGAEVTYGFATRAESFADAINCRTLAPMATLGQAWRGDPARRDRIVAAAFAMWSREADLRFRPAAAGEAPDILIGAQGAPRRIAFANVWHGDAAPGRMARLERATICLNPAVTWTAEAGPVPEGSFDLGTVLAHEIGHAIGLDHPGAAGALMGYSNQGRHRRADGRGHRRGGGALRAGAELKKRPISRFGAASPGTAAEEAAADAEQRAAMGRDRGTAFAARP